MNWFISSFLSQVQWWRKIILKLLTPGTSIFAHRVHLHTYLDALGRNKWTMCWRHMTSAHQGRHWFSQYVNCQLQPPSHWWFAGAAWNTGIFVQQSSSRLWINTGLLYDNLQATTIQTKMIPCVQEQLTKTSILILTKTENDPPHWCLSKCYHGAPEMVGLNGLDADAMVRLLLSPIAPLIFPSKWL